MACSRSTALWGVAVTLVAFRSFFLALHEVDEIHQIPFATTAIPRGPAVAKHDQPRPHQPPPPQPAAPATQPTKVRYTL